MRTKVYLAAAMAVLIVVSLIFWHGRLSQDFWPFDSSRVGPNLVASVVQWAIILIAASLLYPPFRRAVDRWLRGHMKDAHDEIHDHLHHLTEQLGLERFERKPPTKGTP